MPRGPVPASPLLVVEARSSGDPTSPSISISVSVKVDLARDIRTQRRHAMPVQRSDAVTNDLVTPLR